MEIMRAYPLTEEKYLLAESPFYDPRNHRFSWVDIVRGQVFTMQEDGKRSCFSLGQPVGAALPVKDREGLLLAAKDGFYCLENQQAEKILDLSEVYQPHLRSNDAKADPRGRIFFGSSLAGEGNPEGDLYRYDETGVRVIEAHTKIANGMAWNQAHDRFYFADSGEHAVFVYDYEESTGEIRNRKVLFRIEDGVPDGMCIDFKDRLYTAVWGGSRIEIHDGITGEKTGEIRVNAKQVTSCCFGGEDFRTLLITSAGIGMEGEMDGCLFACRMIEAGPGPDYAKI